MIRFIKTILSFGLFSTFFYISVLILWGSIVGPVYFKKNLNYKLGLYGHLHSRIKDIPSYPDVDILFLGSSHAYRGFDIRIYDASGYKSFNLGSSSQTPLQTEILLSRYLDILNPKLVIYEVNPDLFAFDGVESGLDLLANDGIDFKVLKMVLAIRNIKLINTFIYASFRKILGLDDDFAEKKHKNGDQYINGGFVQRMDTSIMEAQPVEAGHNYYEYQWNSFIQILNMLRTKDVEVKLIQAPVRETYIAPYLDTLIFNRQMDSLSTYYDMSRMEFLNDNLHFYDDQHLNQQGVELFNTHVIKNIL